MRPELLALIAALTLVTMIGLGASLTLDDFRRAARAPGRLALGLGLQFGLMPAVAFGATQLFALPDDAALGLLIIGCVPGGTASNLLAFLAGADLALSVSMTAISTTLSLVMTPLLLWGYGQALGADAGGALAPAETAMALLGATAPVAIGVALRQLRPKLAAKVERVGAIAGTLLLVGLVLVYGAVFTDELWEAMGAPLAAALATGISGFGIAYAMTRALGAAHDGALSFGFEAGFQSLPVAAAVVALAVPEARQAAVGKMPLVYASAMLSFGLVVVVAARLGARRRGGPPS